MLIEKLVEEQVKKTMSGAVEDLINASLRRKFGG